LSLESLSDILCHHFLQTNKMSRTLDQLLDNASDAVAKLHDYASDLESNLEVREDRILELESLVRELKDEVSELQDEIRELQNNL
jgi:peptidoglycan hydrolase CwlO-like protein